MKFIESFLDRHTMYLVVLVMLGALTLVSFIFSIVGWLPFTVLELLYILTTISLVATGNHYILKLLTKAPANYDSTLITIFILFFLYLPTTRVDELVGIALVAVVAVAGKYILAYRKLHLANPAALAAVLVGLTDLSFASWWVATPTLLPFVVIGGLLVAIKLRRLTMVMVGLAAALVTFVGMSLWQGSVNIEDLQFFFLYTPIIFFLTIMATEPLTTPGTQRLRLVYAVFLGVLFNVPFVLGPFYNTPELTLVLANLVFYPFGLRRRLALTLIEKKQVAKQTMEFSFKADENFRFLPGQYLEWTLPHKDKDARGIRRYFTIASAPSEESIKLTARISEPGSSFKKELQELETGTVIHATARAGDFVLPNNSTEQKYIFIAGGIGVTPFRSMVKEQLLHEKQLDAVMFYLNKTEEDIAYRDLFDSAQSVGLKTVYVIDKPTANWNGEVGYITEEMLTRLAPDYKDRLVYVSGPPGLVRAYTVLFHQLGIPPSRVKTDYFPGLA